MIIPVRCFTCGKVLADKWEYYKKKVEETKKESKEENPQTKEILDELGLDKYCCRRIMLGHVDLIDEI